MITDAKCRMYIDDTVQALMRKMKKATPRDAAHIGEAIEALISTAGYLEDVKRRRHQHERDDYRLED